MGESVIQSTEDRINLWEQWMNSRKLFSRKELDEMKDHLLEEIDYLMTHEDLSELEAFHKSVDIIGMKKELIEEESKVKKESIKRKWQVSISCLVALCFVGLSVFAIQYAFQKRSHVAGHIPYGYPCEGDIDTPTKTIEFRNADRSSLHKERRVCFNVKEDIVNIHNSSHPVDVQNTETGAIITFKTSR